MGYKYDRGLLELNEERIYDYPSESTNSKMIDIYDNVHDPSIIEPTREVECEYPTGVGSGEDEIAARIVEITPNPAYGTAAMLMK